MTRPMPADARRAFELGFCPQFTCQGLLALRDELTLSTGRLCHGVSVVPDSDAASDFPVDAACAVGFAVWQGGEVITAAGALAARWEDVVLMAERLVGDSASAAFLRWFDGDERGWTEGEIDAALLAIVESVIAARAAEAVLV